VYLIDRISHANRFKNVHPVEKFIFTIGALVLSIVTQNPAIMAVLFILVSLIIVNAAGVKFSDYVKLLSVPFIFIVFGVLTIIFEIDGNPVSHIWHAESAGVTFSISNESASEGGILFLRSFTSVSCFYFFILTTPVTDVEFILKKMKLPSLFIEIFMMTYRFIFITAEMAGMIVISQRSRSGYSTFRNGLKSIGLLASSVFVKSYFFSKVSYNAMLSRGCDGVINVIDDTFRYSAVNIFIIAFFNICFIILILWLG